MGKQKTKNKEKIIKFSEAKKWKEERKKEKEKLLKVKLPTNQSLTHTQRKHVSGKAKADGMWVWGSLDIFDSFSF